MYKTIRHGENSLQYTILPQNDDFRIEGKLGGASRGARSSAASASSSASCSSSGSAGVPKRSAAAPRRRRSFFAYLGLIFVCTIIIGAVLIPFLVSAECLPNPKEWFIKTKAALTRNTAAEKQVHSAAIAAVAVPINANIVNANDGSSVGQSVQIINHNGVEQFIVKLNKSKAQTLPTTAPPPPPPPPPPPLTSYVSTTTSTAAPRTTSTAAAIIPQQSQSNHMPPTALPPPSMPVTSTALPATAPPTVPPLINRLLPTTITTRIIQVPLLKSAAKKPIMPPVMAKAQSTQLQDTAAAGAGQQAAAQNKNKNNDWMNTHWPYIDPSTYFQWAGYKTADSVLLPALLGFALIGMILIITVCLVARNKRTIVSSVRKRHRNDIEEQGAEDNATLLTATNLSDDD